MALCALVLPASAQAWTWPVDGPVLRPFSFDRARPYASGQHRGVDLGAPTGTNVQAPAQGVVTFAGTVPTGGKTVSIETPLGYTATLVHLGSIAIARGTSIREGAVVGTVGPSGVADQAEPYVYFGLRATQEEQGYVDPLAFLPPRPAAATARPQQEAQPVASPVATAPAAQAQPVEAATARPRPAAEQAGVPPVEAPAATPAAEAGMSITESAPAPLATTLRRSTTVRDVVDEAGRPRVGGVRTPIHASAHRRPADVSSDGTAVSAGTLLAGALRAATAQGVQGLTTVAPLTTSRRSSSSRRFAWQIGLVALLLVLSLALACTRAVARKRARIMSFVEPESSVVRTEAKAQHLGRPSLALCLGEAPPGPRRRVRGSSGHLCAVPPLEREPGSDGERHRRARDAGDGHGRSRRRLAA